MGRPGGGLESGLKDRRAASRVDCCWPWHKGWSSNSRLETLSHRGELRYKGLFPLKAKLRSDWGKAGASHVLPWDKQVSAVRGVLTQGLEVPIGRVRKGHMPVFTHKQQWVPSGWEAN